MAHPAAALLRFCSETAQDVKVSESSEPSQDSCVSCDDVLSCGEYIEDLHASTHVSPASPSFMTQFCDLREVDTFEQACHMIKNELRRELELQPSPGHLDRHPDLTPSIRSMTISWLAEVAIELGLQQETLFMATAFFNRYLSLSQGVYRSMVQLVAVACIALAVKQEEVDGADDFSPAVWTGLTANTFQAQDVVRMEWLVMISLDWRISAPTVYSFLHLLSYAVSSTSHLSDLTICIASYLAELSLLDYGLATQPYSHVACAALLLADSVARSATPTSAGAASAAASGGGGVAAAPSSAAFAATLQDVMPSLDVALVCACRERLGAIVVAASVSDELAQLTAPMSEKYAQSKWAHAAAVVSAHYVDSVAMSD